MARAAVTVAVQVGAAFQSNVAAEVHSQGCVPVVVSVSGGRAPYHLTLQDGGEPTLCAGGASATGLTSYVFDPPTSSLSCW